MAAADIGLGTCIVRFAKGTVKCGPVFDYFCYWSYDTRVVECLEARFPFLQKPTCLLPTVYKSKTNNKIKIRYT